MVFTLVLGFVLGATTIIFALQNTEVVELTFFSWQFASPLALVIIFTAAVGGLLGVLASIPASIHRSLINRRLRKENQQLRENDEVMRQMVEDLQNGVVVERKETV
ncbi:MAG TPA: LapA family protein [Candidatus Paceibacterota bacterium]